MSCCGGKRSALTRTHSELKVNNKIINRIAKNEFEYFKYTGSAGLTALGPISGKKYRFDFSGSVIQVDARDTPYLLGIPNLKKVANP